MAHRPFRAETAIKQRPLSFDLNYSCVNTSLIRAAAHPSPGAILEEQFDLFKDEMQSMFQQRGINVDLSTVNMKDGEQDIMRKLFEAMAPTEEEPSQPKPKSKKELQKELKERPIQEMQKEGLSHVYKRLARELHPDLEQDRSRKIEKEEMMKQLTTAYQNEDLYTLLALEIEWMNRSNQQPMKKTSDEHKAYNAILKEQIEALKESIHRLKLHPKYLPLEPFFPDHMFGLFFLKRGEQHIKGQIQKVNDYLMQLKHPQALKALRTILSSA